MTTFPTSGAAIANPGWLGNVGRHALIGPGLATRNMTLAKNTQLAEGRRLQFLAEFFNLFNRANFDTPSATVFTNVRVLSPTVGQITDTGTTSRQCNWSSALSFERGE